MASIAVLPVLIGLAVDYAIQFQARFDEARAGARRRSPAEAAASAPAAAGGPTIATAGPGDRGRLPRAAALAGADGARLRRAARARHRVALACALTAGLRGAGALLASRAGARGRAGSAAARLRAYRRFDCARAARGSADGAVAAWAAPSAPSAALGLLARAARGGCSAIGLAVAVVGWAVDTQTEVVSDVRELVPARPPGAEGRRTSSRRRPASPARST